MDTVQGHTAWQGVLAGWPGSARPQSGSLCSCCFPCLDHLPLIYWFLSVFQLSLEFTFQETSLMRWAGLGASLGIMEGFLEEVPSR